MSKKTAPDLKKLFKEASEIAKQVPESMHEAAFNRAIDLLTGVEHPSLKAKGNPPKQKEKRFAKTTAETVNQPAEDLISAIDSTQHPEVTSTHKILDLSLMVLEIAHTDHSIDGLTPRAIAKILTDKFRINAKSNAVNMALGRATTLVNRIPDGSGFLYKIMAPGVEHLAHLGSSESSPKVSTPRRKSKKKSTPNKAKIDNSKQSDGPKKKEKKTKKKEGATPKIRKGNGPKTAVMNLANSGFFDKGKTAPEVQAHLKNKRGLNFSPDQLRMAMLRLVRDENFERDENAEGQYEYTKPKV